MGRHRFKYFVRSRRANSLAFLLLFFGDFFCLSIVFACADPRKLLIYIGNRHRVVIDLVVGNKNQSRRSVCRHGPLRTPNARPVRFNEVKREKHIPQLGIQILAIIKFFALVQIFDSHWRKRSIVIDKSHLIRINIDLDYGFASQGTLPYEPHHPFSCRVSFGNCFAKSRRAFDPKTSRNLLASLQNTVASAFNIARIHLVLRRSPRRVSASLRRCSRRCRHCSPSFVFVMNVY